MTAHSDFTHIYRVLKDMFDSPTPPMSCEESFVAWRYQTYAELRQGIRPNLPLKTWWPQYIRGGDFRLEVSIGARLIQQVSWSLVRTCIEKLQDCLANKHKQFDLEELLRIPLQEYTRLLRSSRFPTQKAQGILGFCAFVKEKGGIEQMFQEDVVQENMRQLQQLRIGFGPETRDCVLLYAANLPVFIADRYARQLLHLLQITDSKNYATCQDLLHRRIQQDCDEAFLASIKGDYTEEELHYALCNSPQHSQTALVLLYQQLHAGIVELGISGRWEEFRERLTRLSQRNLLPE